MINKDKKDFLAKNWEKIHWYDMKKHLDLPENIEAMCTECISQQLEKYGKITIECRGPLVLENLVDEQILKNLTEEEKNLLLENENAFVWARNNIEGYEDRFYQNLIASCSATQKTVSINRRGGKTFIVATIIAHRLCTKPDYNILAICPYELQVQQVVEGVINLLSKLNPEYGTYEDFISDFKKTPIWRLWGTNGSSLKAFNANNEGNKIRGQPGDLLYFDEASLLSPDATAAAMGILLENQEVEVMMTSTPSNNPTDIFIVRENDPEYKAFWYPVYYLPHYNEKFHEKILREFLKEGKAYYMREALCVAADSDNSVFPSIYVSKNTLKDIDRDKILKERTRYILSLGVDWNGDTIGARIRIVAYDKQENIIVTAHKEEVRKDEWTQLTAVEKIVELTNKFVPDHFYLDKGYGHTNTELLKKVAMSAPSGSPLKKLYHIKPIDFNSKVTMFDPISKQETEKHAKNFMVERLRALIEEDKYKFDEEYDKDIIIEMANYRSKAGISGRSIYYTESEIIGDHSLDALMLACMALIVEYDSLFNPYTNFNLSEIIITKTQNNSNNSTQNNMFNYVSNNQKRKVSERYSRLFGGAKRAEFKQDSTVTKSTRSFRKTSKWGK